MENFATPYLTQLSRLNGDDIKRLHGSARYPGDSDCPPRGHRLHRGLGQDKGLLKPTTVVEGGTVEERLVFHLRDWLRDEDLFLYGMTPQFLARIHDEVEQQHGQVRNFASLLRCACLLYLQQPTHTLGEARRELGLPLANVQRAS